MGELTKKSTAKAYGSYEVGKYLQWKESGASWPTICWSTYSFEIDEPCDSLSVRLYGRVITYSNNYRVLIDSDSSNDNDGSLSTYDFSFASGDGKNPDGAASEQGWNTWDTGVKTIEKKLDAGTHYLHIVSSTSNVGAIDVYESSSYVKVNEKRTYSVSYNANAQNGGTVSNLPNSQTKTYGESLTLSSKVPTHSDILNAIYTVTFDANGGDAIKPSSEAYNKTKYTFSKWNTKSNGSGVSYNSAASYTANAETTLYAQWDSSTSTNSVTLPTDSECVRSGYELLGFSIDSDSVEADYIYGSSYTPSKSITLYAIWKPKGCVRIANTSGLYEMYRVYIANNELTYEPYIPHIYTIDGVWVKCI